MVAQGGPHPRGFGTHATNLGRDPRDKPGAAPNDKPGAGCIVLA